jgi:hypothetical protein
VPILRYLVKLGTSIRRIVAVKPECFRVELEYADGLKGTVDLSDLFGDPRGKPLVAEILRGGLFGKCFVESGALAWPNGYELCPDALRARIAKKRGHRAA